MTWRKNNQFVKNNFKPMSKHFISILRGLLLYFYSDYKKMDTHCLLLIPIQIKRKLVISELVNPKTASEKVNIFTSY
jgi:hypothetical protein